LEVDQRVACDEHTVVFTIKRDVSARIARRIDDAKTFDVVTLA
jgi:hypothetical protein